VSAERPADPVLEELLGRIAAEAARRASRAPVHRRPAWDELASGAAIAEPPPGVPAFRIRDDRRYRVEDFLALQGDEFLDACYRALLGRLPDADGLAAFTARLARGARPVEIVGRLALSPEGRAHGARVSGLWLRLAPALAFRVPVLGYVLEWVVTAILLPVHARDARAREFAAASRLREIREEATAARRRLQAEIERVASRRR
jgi:hypothetical protein